MSGDRSDPLAQPTRARVFERLAGLRGPARVEQIADSLGIHPNSARAHLEVLVGAGLVRRDQVPSGKGRPHFEWTVAPGAEEGATRPAAYTDLARWLARALKTGKSRGHIARAGREIGREIGPAPRRGVGAHDLFEATLSSMGFQPQAKAGRSAITYTLCSCPYRLAATQYPEVVCPLHEGMTRGLLDGIAPGAELAEFVSKDPAAAGCLVRVSGLRKTDAGGKVVDSTTGHTGEYGVR